MNLQPEHYELLVVSGGAPVQVFDAQPALVEVFDWWDPPTPNPNPNPNSYPNPNPNPNPNPKPNPNPERTLTQPQP